MDIDRKLKVRLIDHLGETDFRLSEGANSDIQLEALIALESSRRLAKLGGTEKALRPIPRRRPAD